jgi:hypothetical protein
LYHLNKRLVFEEEMDKEEVGTRWFFNRDKPSIDLFRLETKFWKSCGKRTAPWLRCYVLSADSRVTAAKRQAILTCLGQFSQLGA